MHPMPVHAPTPCACMQCVVFEGSAWNDTQLTGYARVQGATVAQQPPPAMRHALPRQQAAPYPGQVQQQLPTPHPGQWPQSFPQTAHHQSDAEVAAAAAGGSQAEGERRRGAPQHSGGSLAPQWAEGHQLPQRLPQSPADAAMHSSVADGLMCSPALPSVDEHAQPRQFAALAEGAQQEALSMMRQGCAAGWQDGGLLPKPGQPRLWRQASPAIDLDLAHPSADSPGEVPPLAAAHETAAGSCPTEHPAQLDSSPGIAVFGAGSPTLQSPGTPCRQASQASPARSASQQRTGAVQATSREEDAERTLPQQPERGVDGAAPDDGRVPQLEAPQHGPSAPPAALSPVIGNVHPTCLRDQLYALESLRPLRSGVCLL